MKCILHKKWQILITIGIIVIGCLCIYLLGAWGTKQFSENYTGRGDWMYKIDHKYSLVQTNSRTIYVEWEGKGIIVDSYVSELAVVENYIFAKQVTVPKDLREKIDLSNPCYFVIVRETGDRLGPYSTAGEFKQALNQIGVTESELFWELSTDYKNK